MAEEGTTDAGPQASSATPRQHGSTQWWMIRLAQGQGPEARAALSDLIKRYEGYIVATIRRLRYPADQTVEEAKQEFLTRLLERNDLAVLDESRGSFRAWLSQALRSDWSNAWKRWHAQGNPNPHITYPGELVGFEPVSGEHPEQHCLRAYALDTMRYVSTRLRESSKDQARFDSLTPFLSARQMDPGDLAAAAAALRMPSARFAKAVFDLRRRFNDALRIAVADTLDLDPELDSSKAEIDREIAFLWRVFAKPSPY